MATALATRVRRLYGASPAHLVLVLAGFAVVAYAVQLVGLASLWNRDVWWQSIIVWFVGAAIAHDFVLFPLYAAADRVLVAITRRRRRSTGPERVPLVNFVRVPLLACALTTLVFFPGIIRQGSGSYTRATGQTQEPFLHRWIVLCAVILLLGAIAYVVARVVAVRRPLADSEQPEEREMPGRTPRTSAAAVFVVVVLAFVVGVRRRRS